MIAIWFDFFIVEIKSFMLETDSSIHQNDNHGKVQVSKYKLKFSILIKKFIGKKCKLLLILKLECFENLLFFFQVEKTTL